MNVKKIATYVGLGSALYMTISVIGFTVLLKRADLTMEEFEDIKMIYGYQKAVKIALLRIKNKEN